MDKTPRWGREGVWSVTHLVPSQTGAEVTWGLRGGVKAGHTWVGGALGRIWVAKERGQQAVSSQGGGRVGESAVPGQRGRRGGNGGAACPCCPGTKYKDEAGPGTVAGSSLLLGRARPKSSHPGCLEGPHVRHLPHFQHPTPAPCPPLRQSWAPAWTRKGWAPEGGGSEDQESGKQGREG